MSKTTKTGYRIMVRHIIGQIGTVKLAELKVRNVDFALAKLPERLSTRSVRLARMILIQAIRNAMVNDSWVRNVADLAAVPFQIPEIAVAALRDLVLKQAADRAEARAAWKENGCQDHYRLDG